jgi:hypothetical protein
LWDGIGCRVLAEQPVHVKLVLLDAMAENSQLDSGLPVVMISQVKI